MLIFMYGSGLAGIAGAVLAPIKSVSTTMGFSYAVGSYMVIVLGGVGNLLGVPTGAFLIGEGETLLAYKYNSVIGQLLGVRGHRDRHPRLPARHLRLSRTPLTAARYPDAA